MMRISPRASAGLRIFAASSPPWAFPAPTMVCSSSMKRMISGRSFASRTISLSRASNSPRKLVPATTSARSSARKRLPESDADASPSEICFAMAETIAVLPTPGSPRRTGLFFCRRPRMLVTLAISASRPKKMSPRSVASRPRSVVYCESAGGRPSVPDVRFASVSSGRSSSLPKSGTCSSPRCDSSSESDCSWSMPALVRTSRISRSGFVRMACMTCSVPTYGEPNRFAERNALVSTSLVSVENGIDFDACPIRFAGFFGVIFSGPDTFPSTGRSASRFSPALTRNRLPRLPSSERMAVRRWIGRTEASADAFATTEASLRVFRARRENFSGRCPMFILSMISREKDIRWWDNCMDMDVPCQ